MIGTKAFRTGPARGWASRAAAALLALAAASAASKGAAERPALGLDYALYLGGLRALEFTSRVQLAEEAYDIRLQTRTAGLVGKLFPFVLEARSRGSRVDGRLRPSRYASANRWGEEGKRWVALDYPDDVGAGPSDRLPAVAAEPSSDSDDRDVVPTVARRATVDPVSAVYGLALTGAEGCAGRRAVFDGRRRYDIVAEDRGTGTVPPREQSVYIGPARSCRLRVEMIEGFWTQYDMKRRYPDTVDVWLAEVADALPAVPVRLEAKTILGALVVHLTGVEQGAAARLPPTGLFPLETARQE